MLTKIELQYMDAVIQMNRRQRNHEIDWEERRFELTKAALFVVPMFPDIHNNGTMTPDIIAKKAIDVADAAIAVLMTTENPK